MPSNAALQRRRRSIGGGGTPPVALTAEYIVIAGGGGGGSAYGGGGAGGYRTAADFSIDLGSPYTVTVGAGGNGGAPAAGDNGSNGNDSILSSITSAGGGGGGDYEPDSTGLDGGSGGGAGYAAGGGVGGSGNVPPTTPPQGNDGGSSSGSAPYYGGGGGGGAGAVGGNGTTTTGGAGGVGLESYITGSSAYRAGGGGGGVYSSGTPGAGGLGGGGAAGSSGVIGASGASNTGGGGGAGHAGTSGLSSWTGGGAGGSGVVIIKVPGTVVAEFSAGVAYNYIPLDDFNVYEITAAGVSDTVTFSQGAVTTINNSLLFNDNAGAYMSRTPSSAGNTNVFTYSGWIKLGDTGTGQKTLLSAGPDNNNRSDIWVYGNTIWFSNRVVSTTYTTIYTKALLRDPSAWYHIVVKVDQTKSFVDIYINGVKQETTVSSANYGVATLFNTTNAHAISRLSAFASSYFDGCMSDVYFIDGEALDPSRFGKKDADGIWQPISYTGSYGTNGFHLDFADNSTIAALGTDTSGNGNNWTPTNLTTDDQVTDTPSVNYATLNPLDWNITYIDDGNLYAYNTFGAWQLGRGTFGVSSGKWYWEATGATANVMVGIATSKAGLGSYVGQDAYGWGYYGADGYKYNNATWIAYGATYTSTDVIGVAFDADNGTLEFYKNGTSQGTAFTGLTNGPYFPALSVYNSAVRHNFGQTPFVHTPPTGFVALNSANLPAPTITDSKAHFDISVYTGNGTTQAIGGFEFQPDFVWIKNRDAAYLHWLQDAVRGAQKQLNSNVTNAENSYGNVLASFDTNGFTVNSSVGVNAAGQRHVAWNWNAGGSTVTNNDGTITSQVRANTDAGFSIVNFALPASGNFSVGHGLSQAPDMYIVKRRGNTSGWGVWHTGLSGGTYYLLLDGTGAQVNDATIFSALPDASVLNIGSAWTSASSGIETIAYCFHSVDGFSKFGTYTGNGNATYGPFIYTGFRPAFVMLKSSSVGGSPGYDWIIHDTSRAPYNASDKQLVANSNVEENKDSGGFVVNDRSIDILSNGFKLRAASAGRNQSGQTYIYMAFAENPFKTARAR